MGTALLQPSFSGGELSPSLYARVDIARYGSSLRTCENFVVRPYGGVENRAGLRFVKESKNSAVTCIVIPFQYSTDISYVIELGDLYARFYANGAALLAGMTHVEIVTPWSAAEAPFVRFTQSADVLYLVHPDHAPQELRRTSVTSFSLTDYAYKNGPFRSVNTDQSINVYASAETGTVTLTAASPIFLAGHIGGLFKIEEEHLEGVVQWEASKRIATENENPFGVRRRSDGKVYRCATNQVVNPSGGDAQFITGTIRPIHDAGTLSDGDGNLIADLAQRAGVDWEYLHSGFGIVRIDSLGGGGGTTANATVLSRLPNTVVGGATSSGTFSFTGNGANRRFFMVGATAASDDTYRVLVDSVQLSTAGYDVGDSYTGYNVSVTFAGAPAAAALIEILSAGTIYFRALGDGVTTVFTFDGGPSASGAAYQAYVATVLTAATITPSSPNAGRGLDLAVAPLNTKVVAVDQLSANNTSSAWSFGAWSTQYGFPSEVEFYGDRLDFASTRTDPQTQWLTRIADYVNFNVSNPLVDDDSITATLNARQINAIRDLIPLNNLVILTSGGEWKAVTGQNDVLTPSTIAFKPQSFNGAESLPALTINDAAIYAARGYKVRTIGYQFDKDGYVGDDLTVFADHLVKFHSIVSWAYQQVPITTVWAVRDDGVMLSMAYQPEQQVVGWARHITDGFFESVTVVTEAGADVLYAVVRRTVGGTTKRYIERMDERDYANVRDAFFVDSGLTFDGRNQLGTVTLTGADFTVGHNLTATASLASFAASDVGDMIVFAYGASGELRLQIVAYTSTTVVTVRPLKNVVLGYQGTLVAGWAFARDTLSGFSHLAAKTVAILADGNVQPSVDVSLGGLIALETPAVVVQAGLPYTATMTTLDLNNPGGESIRMRRKVIKRIGLLVEETRNIKAGQLDNLEEVEARDYEGLTTPANLLSGLVEVYCSSEWDTNGRVSVVQDMPLPIRVLGLIPEIEAGE